MNKLCIHSLGVVFLLSMLGCSGAPPQPATSTSTSTSTAPATARSQAAPKPISFVDQVRAYPTDGLALDVLEPDQLATLEARGFALDQITDLPSLKRVWSLQIDGLADQVQRDLVKTHEEAKKWPASNVGRRFDTGWLADGSLGMFQLVGVSNRADRYDMTGACELRLIYRLAYQQPQGSSRLPFTVNVVMRPQQTDVTSCLQRWKTPLDVDAFDPQELSLVQVELNAQLVRWPSGLETEFAGQAAYLMSIWGPDAKPLPLENTPAVSKLMADDSLRQELAAWVDEHHEAIDRGVYQLPDKFLATSAVSYSTLGIHRLANRPFDVVFPKGEGLKPAQGKTFRTKKGLVERMNNRTCTGCHQTASTAGFHFLGIDDEAVNGITNRLVQPFSTHAAQDRARRKAWLSDPSPHRPHALAYDQTPAGLNATCVLGQDLPPVPCEAGLECVEVARNTSVGVAFGQCLLPVADKDKMTAGQTCRTGAIRAASLSASDEPFGLHAYKDKVELTQRYGLPEDKKFSSSAFNCRPTVIGVPLGRTYRACTSQERKLTDVGAEICAVVGGSRFDKCVEEDFHACLSGAIGRGMVDTCSPTRPCREDYICQKLPWQHQSIDDQAGKALSDQSIGFCTPTYFVFQLRLDGHPKPMP